MPWPLSRNESAGSEEEAGGRQGEARDPAAELRARTRRRLIGASLLLLAAIVVLPMLLDTTPRPVPEDIAITVTSPPPAPAAPVPVAKPPAVDEKIAEPAAARPEAEPAEPPARPAAPAEPKPLQQATAPERPEAPPAAAPVKSKFVVQVAALSSAGAADELVARLSLGGFSAYAESVGTAGGTLHRVRVGPYASRDDAQRAIDRLKAAGHRATLVGG